MPEPGSSYFFCFPTTKVDWYGMGYCVPRRRGGGRCVAWLALAIFLLFVFVPGASHDAHTELYCRRCGALISHSGAHGPAGAKGGHFKSPQGDDLEVATFLPRDQNGVADVHNVDVSGVPDTTSSFYPPYGWQVATCSVCGAHVGWHFMHPGTSKPTETCPLDVPYDKDAGKTPKAGKPPPAKPANGAAPLPPRLDARQHLRDSKHVGDLLRKLVGLCQAVSHGYWTYEWCFRKTVSQFHLEPAPKDYKGPKVDLVNVNKVQYIRTPNWSLGKYKVESMLPEDLSFDAPAAGNVYVSHHFIGGQHCDETRNGRHTEVRLHCCVGQARATPQSNANTPGAWQGVAVRGIKETAVCRYLIDVCVPSLCDLPSFKSGGLKDGDQGKKADPAGGAGATKPSGGGAIAQPQAPCSFFGLLWNKLVSRESDAMRWVAAVKPVTGISQ